MARTFCIVVTLSNFESSRLHWFYYQAGGIFVCDVVGEQTIPSHLGDTQSALKLALMSASEYQKYVWSVPEANK